MLTFALLPLLAEHQLAGHLHATSAREFALYSAGQSPWRWQFRDADDIVAGRVFGVREFSFEADGLRVRSDGAAFEIGLPLTRRLDLRRFPVLHIAASADPSASVRVVTRSTLAAPESAGAAVPLRGDETTLDLRAGALPERAAMLRLRFDLPAGHTLRLHGATLDLPANAPPPSIRELPAGTVEQQLLALRRIHDDAPADIVVPAGGAPGLRAQSGAQDPSVRDRHEGSWIVVVAFIAVALLARLRPPRNARVRALVELVLALAVPLWLIVGGRFSGRIDGAQAVLIAATTTYSLSLGWPGSWRRNGTARTWILALAIVAVALFIGLALHDESAGLRPLGVSHMLRYFGWALAQQYLICAVCLERWRTLTGRVAPAIYLSALCFALLHTPNSTLMLATFAGGLLWCSLYVRERALLPLACSHAASAMILIALLPPQILLSAEVGARFFQ